MDAVLRELAERPLGRAVEDDPHWQHITHCSECYREFLAFNNAFRQQAKARRVRRRLGRGGRRHRNCRCGTCWAYNQGFLFQKRPQNAELAWVKTNRGRPFREPLRRFRGAEADLP